MTELDAIRDGWDLAAREDAMFNIVTETGRRNGGWTPDEFFAHGEVEIDAMLTHLDALNLRGPRHWRALDFGCGVGRLTQALHPEYMWVSGCDISEEMIRLADRHNRWGSHCSYVVTGECLFDSYHLRGQLGFDLIYSRITLQHMPTAYQYEYLWQFVRLLHPDGVAVFQIPDGPEYHHENEWLSMYGVPRAEVEDWVGDVGGDLLDVQQLEEPDSQWVAYRYTMRARGSR